MTGIGGLQSPLLFFPGFARHLFGSANKFAVPNKFANPNKFAASNKFAAPSKDSSPVTQMRIAAGQ